MPTPLDPAFVPKLAKKARLKHDRHSNKTMILYPERGLELNDSAAEIAKRCDGTMSVLEIAKDIVVKNGLDEGQIESITKDVIELLDNLQQKGLLE